MADEPLIAELRKFSTNRLEAVIDAAHEAAASDQTSANLRTIYGRIQRLAQEVLTERLTEAALRGLVRQSTPY